MTWTPTTQKAVKEALEEAPHGSHCSFVRQWISCDCYKAKALELIRQEEEK